MTSSKLLADVFADVGAWAEACGGHIDRRKALKTAQKQCNDAQPFDGLSRLIEGEVIPRLMLAHRLEGLAAQAKAGASAISPEDVTELVRIILEHDNTVAYSYIQALRSRGVTDEQLYLEVLTPSARLLGEMWRQDLCDFTDVTVGLTRLQSLFHELHPAFDDEELSSPKGKVLLLPMPGEQHTFGIMVVEEFFRRAGWQCCTAMPESKGQCLALVKADSFDVAGISISCDAFLGRAAPLIQAIRKASKNKSLIVLVGGPLFLEHPEYVSQIGADGTADDGHQAVLRLRSLFDTNASTRR